MQDFSFENDGLRLDGTIFRPSATAGPAPVILFVHGWTSERARSHQYAEALVKLGYVCVLFDMRGHGTSEGNRDSSSSEDFLRDVVAAYDYTTKLEGIDAGNISVIGSSFGGYLIPLLTKERGVKNLILRAPADYPNNLFSVPRNASEQESFDSVEWRKEKRNLEDSYALQAVHDFDGNILIIESELDNRIPHQTIENYANAIQDKTKLTHILMKRAPHSIKEGPFKDEVTRILKDWFSSKMTDYG